MAWIEVHDTLREHHKTYALAALLKVEQFAAVGLTVSLWTWAVNHAQDGDLGKYPAAAIASACLWRRKPGVLIEALQASGFVTCDMQIHDWDVYAGKLLEQREIQREQARVRQQKRRNQLAAQGKQQSRGSHADVARDITPSSPVNNEGTVPNPTVHNHISSLRSDITPSPEVPEEHEKPVKHTKISERFEALWAQYPKKQGKDAALKAYQRAIKAGVEDDEISRGIAAYTAYLQRNGTAAKYIKQGGTFFSQQSWQDDYATQQAPERVYEEFTGW